MLHAIRNAVRTVDQGGDFTLFVGPDYAARWLEVVVLDDDPTEEPVVVHAMRAREKWTREL